MSIMAMSIEGVMDWTEGRQRNEGLRDAFAVYLCDEIERMVSGKMDTV